RSPARRGSGAARSLLPAPPARAQRTRTPGLSRPQRLLDPAPQIPRADLPGHVADDPAAAVDEEGLRQGEVAVLRGGDVVVVVHDGVRDPMPPHEPAGIAAEIVDIDAEHGHVGTPLLRRGRESRRLLHAWVAPRGP